ncbi:MAG: hypothetical protein GX591_08455 [Planctomycetes bacterium]|nr:hypothetical protein [Planctomycetota bacterium]
MNASPRRPRHTAPGLGMVELLLSLAIMAMLLTSVAAAFHASLNTVDENQKIATVTHNARIVLNRMMAEIRQADEYGGGDHFVWITPPTFGNVTRIEYESVGDALVYRRTVNGIDCEYTILSPEDGVTIHAFDITPLERRDAHGVTYVTGVKATLDVSVGGNRFAVTAGTNPRRNLTW